MVDDTQLVAGLRNAMGAAKVTLKELSRRTGVPYRSLQNYMGGRSRLPADVYVALCLALRVDNQFIVQGTFQLPVDELYDVLWRVFGDGLLDLQSLPNTTGPETVDKHNRKQAIAHAFAARLSKAYDEEMRYSLSRV